MSKRTGATLVLILAAALVLAACGGPDQDSPEGVTAEFFDKLGDLNAKRVSETLCEDYRQNVDFDVPEDFDADVDLNLKFDADDEPSDPEPGDVVDVEVWGEIAVKVRGDHVRYELKQRNDESAAWHVRVTYLDDEWLVCGSDPFILELLDINAYIDGINH